MGWLSGTWVRLRAMTHRSAAEREMDEELRFHLDMEMEKNLREGMTPEEARRRAVLAFGGVEKHREEVREGRRIPVLEDLGRDLRYGLRTLRKSPGFSVSVIATVALGIGVTTAMFSVVDATLLRPLPFAEDERLVVLDKVSAESMSFPGFPKNSPDLSDLDSLRHVFAQVAAYAPGGLNLRGVGEPIRTAVALVTPSFFSTLGVQPQIGRPFTMEEGGPENARVTILSHGLWRRHFGADPQVVGRAVLLNDVEHRVVGVMPPGLSFPGETEVWLPYPIPMPPMGSEAFRMVAIPRIIARLAPGVTPEQAEARLVALRKAYRPDQTAAVGLVRPLRDELIENRRTAVLVLMGAAGLMLLIACANAANLLLSRAARRHREIALRGVLGATSGRIVRQLLVESGLLALISGLLGIALAYASTGALGALVPSSLIGVSPPSVDLRVLAFAATVALASGLVFGLWPALRSRSLNPGHAIKSGQSAGVTAREGGQIRRLFVVAQVSLALMLLAGAGVMLRSFQAVLAVDPGVRPEQVTTLELSLARAGYGSKSAIQQFHADVLDRLRVIPQVEAAAVVNELPLRNEALVSLSVSAEGSTPRAEDEKTFAQYLRVTPEYFRVLGIPLLRGRPALAALDSAGAKEVVISEDLARRLWPGEDPIGQRLVEESPFGPGQARTVVGIVGNVRAQVIDRDEISPEMYLPFSESPSPHAAILARGRARPEVLAGHLREAVQSVDPSQAVYNVRTMEQVIARTIVPRRTTTLLVTIFGALALVLAAIGIYGVISFGVAHRKVEIGIRMAFGAKRSDVMRLVMREGMALATIGVAVGTTGAWMLSRALEGLVYGVSVKDPIAFVAAPLVLLGIAALAAFLPARQAARASPLEAIRTE